MSRPNAVSHWESVLSESDAINAGPNNNTKTARVPMRRSVRAEPDGHKTL